MGFEFTLAILNNPLFNEEYQSIKAAKDRGLINENNDPVVFTSRIPIIDTHVDQLELFKAFGKEDSEYNIACIDLLLEFFHATQYYFDLKVKTKTVKISKLEVERLSKKIFHLSNETTKLTGPHLERLMKKYIEPQQAYFASAIDALWAYKKELLSTQQHLSETSSTTLLSKLQVNAPYNTFRIIADLSEFRNSFNDGADALLAFEHDLTYNNTISIDEKIILSREIMEYRTALCADHMSNLKDTDSVSSTFDKYFLLNHNVKLRNNLKIHLDRVAAQLNNNLREIDLEYPRDPYIDTLSSGTIELGEKLFSKDRTDTARAVRTLDALKIWSDTLFSTCMETEFHISDQTKVKKAINDLVASLKKDIQDKPALGKSALIGLYVTYIKAHVSFTLGINELYNVEDLETVRKNIVSHKDYPLISSHSHRISDNIMKYALIVGLSMAILGAAGFIALALAPKTAKLMACAAAVFADHAQGFVGFAATAVTATAIISAGSTAGVLRFKTPPPPMPHSDIIAIASYAKNNRFTI